ncbi:MAG TPA: hypothetical protein VIF32_06920 [Gemmatimonadaceae bacterium]|jgi:hypothetical protein
MYPSGHALGQIARMQTAARVLLGIAVVACMLIAWRAFAST